MCLNIGGTKRTVAAAAAAPLPTPPPAVTAEQMADPGSAAAKRAGISQRAKRRGTSALKIRLSDNVAGGSGSNVGY